MGAWYCEGEGCGAVVPGSHPAEQGEEGWRHDEPLLCAGCGTESAFSTIEKMVLDREEELHRKGVARTAFESALFEAIREARRKIDRVAGFTGLGDF